MESTSASPPPHLPARAARQRNTAPLKSRLFVLAASGLVPLAIMVVLAVGYLVQERQEATQRSALALSRALATAIDAELRSTAAVLRAVSENEELQAGQWQAFYQVARKVAGQQGWRSMVLADARGRVIFRTAVPFGQADPNPVDPESMTQALVLQRPVVGVVANGATVPGFAVRVPLVVRSRSQPYVLSAVIATDQVLTLLKRQSVPAGWVVGVFDQSGRRVARSKEPATTRPSPTLQALLDEGEAEGTGVTTTAEGVRSHTGYTRIADSRWVVAVAIPDAEAIRATIGPIVAVLLGLLTSLGLSAYLGWFFARKVSEPIGVLKDAAAALGRGDTVRPQALQIAELEEVGTALAQASQQRQRFMQELRQG